MSKVKRYGIHFAVSHMIKEDVNGDYVLASDYDTLRTEADRLKGQVKMLVNQHMPLTDKDCPDGWSRIVEASELAAERDTLRAANQRLEGEVKQLREALTHIIECDWQSRQDATDSTISELKGGVIRNMRGLAHDALSTSNGEVTG